MLGVHEVHERPFVARRQNFVDETGDVGAPVGAGLAKPTAKSRAVDQRVGDLQHRPAAPQTRLERLELIGRHVQFESGLLHQQMRGADGGGPGGDVPRSPLARRDRCSAGR